MIKKESIFNYISMILFYLLMGRKYAIDLLFQFSKFSDLKLNTSKTNAIWIRSKAQSSDKLSNDSGILWTTESFNILGMIYTANLCNIVQLNFMRNWQPLQKEINQWSERNISPIVKIITIKKFIAFLTYSPTPVSP